MVISFEEKDRKRIEATGMNIIQVKLVFYRVRKFLKNIIEATTNYYNSLSPEQKKEFLKLALKDCD
ncbi:MAG: hypothetical protein K2G55_03190 [Lachnospiraceae bacterium]|nr:hypothetical protein [Lachnospiraceae bacterium]MDE7204082.1 hypothetical protein [Lachnospiraceae bacterium]